MRGNAGRIRFAIEFSADAERDFDLIFDHLFESYLGFGERTEEALDHAARRVMDIRRAADRQANLPLNRTDESVAEKAHEDWNGTADTFANSIYENQPIGIYIQGGVTSAYIATVPGLYDPVTNTGTLTLTNPGHEPAHRDLGAEWRRRRQHRHRGPFCVVQNRGITSAPYQVMRRPAVRAWALSWPETLPS